MMIQSIRKHCGFHFIPQIDEQENDGEWPGLPFVLRRASAHHLFHVTFQTKTNGRVCVFFSYTQFQAFLIIQNRFSCAEPAPLRSHPGPVNNHFSHHMYFVIVCVMFSQMTKFSSALIVFPRLFFFACYFVFRKFEMNPFV